jgi:hypothetical protein
MARKKEPEIKKHKAVSSSSFITSIRREEETKKKKTKRTLIITVCAILLAGLLLAGWALLSSSDYFCEHSAAVRVKNHSVSPVMFDYFYRDAYSTFCQQNLDVISLYLDTTKPLDEQWYDQQQNVTWADYFMNLAESSIQRTYCLYDEAMAEGYAATAEDDKAVESAVSKLEAQAKDKDSDLASYLVSYYGRGCTEKTFREYSRIARIAAQVQTQYEQGLSYSSDELSTYYSSHRSAFDAVNYRIYPVAVKNDAGTVDMDASEKLAESIAEESRGDEAKYLSLIEADAGPDSAYATGDYSRRDNYTYTYVPENLADWLFDTGRREGDTTAVQNGENGWFAVYYLSLNTHDYTTADLRVVEVADYYKDADKAYKAAQKLLYVRRSAHRRHAAAGAHPHPLFNLKRKSFHSYLYGLEANPAAGAGQAGVSQPGRLRQGPHRQGHDRRRRGARPSEARLRNHRAHLRQHRHRPGLRGGGQRLPHHHRDAGDHVRRAPPAHRPTARSWCSPRAPRA